MYFHCIRRCTAFYRFVHRFLFDAADIFRCRIRNNTFYHVTHHGKCNTDGRNDFRVFRYAVVDLHFVCAEADQRSGSATNSNKRNLIFFQFIFFCKFQNNRRDLFIRTGQYLCCHILHCHTQMVRDRLHSLSCRVGISIGEMLRFYQPQDIGRAGVGDGDALAAL